MSFDKIFDLTAGLFLLTNIINSNPMKRNNHCSVKPFRLVYSSVGQPCCRKSVELFWKKKKQSKEERGKERKEKTSQEETKKRKGKNVALLIADLETKDGIGLIEAGGY